jgi:hypothetical protein
MQRTLPVSRTISIAIVDRPPICRRWPLLLASGAANHVFFDREEADDQLVPGRKSGARGAEQSSPAR